MVQYLPSTSNQLTVTVQSLQVNTTLTLTGPTEAPQGQSFTLTAQLKRSDTGAVIPNAGIGFEKVTSTGSTLIGVATTNASGIASLTLIEDLAVVYKYQAVFSGMTVEGLNYLPSMGYYTAGMESNIVPLLAVLGFGYLVLRGR